MMEIVSKSSYQYSVGQEREICSEMVIRTRREHIELFGFLKAMVRQKLEWCPHRHTGEELRLDIRYGNGAKAVNKSDIIFIEEEMDILK